MFRRNTIVLASALFTSFAAVASAAPVTAYDSAQNVNLLNNRNVNVTASAGNSEAYVLEWDYDGVGPRIWQNTGGGLAPTDPDTSITMDFGTTRTIDRIRMFEGFGGYGLSAGTSSIELESSPDGIAWSPYGGTATVTNPNGTNTQVALDTPITAQYVRMTGKAYQQANRRWIISKLRALGPAGTLDPSTDHDLVSGSAFSGGIIMTRNGISIDSATDAQFVDDARDPLARQVIFSIGTGDSFQLQFDRTIYFSEFGFTTGNIANNQLDPNALIQIRTSTNGLVWNIVYSGTGPWIDNGMNFVPLALSSGQYLDFTVLSSTTSDNRIGGVAVFQSLVIPEPASLSLLALGSMTLLRRRR